MARRAIAEEAARAGLADQLATAAKVVVTESFTNAVRHAYPGPESGPVEVRAEGDADGIMIVVRDSGTGFRLRTPDESRWGGLGVGLILTLADRVEMHRLDHGGTEVRAWLDASRSSFPAAGPMH